MGNLLAIETFLIYWYSFLEQVLAFLGRECFHAFIVYLAPYLLATPSSFFLESNIRLLAASLLWMAVGALTFSRAMGCAMDCGTTAQY